MSTDIMLLRSSVEDKRPTPANLLDGQPAVNINANSPGLFFKTSDGNLAKVGPATITTDGSTPNSAPLGEIGNAPAEQWWDARTEFSGPVLKLYRGDVLGWQTASGFDVDEATGDFYLNRKMTLRTMVANGTGENSYIQIPNGPVTDQGLIGGSIGMMRVETDNGYLTYQNGTDWKSVQNRNDDALFSALTVTGNTTLGDDCGDLLNIVAKTTIACDLTMLSTGIFFEAAGSGANRIGFQAPPVLSNPLTVFTLPDGDGAQDSVLGTDGAGQLQWINRGGVPSGAANDTEVFFDDNDEIKGTPLLRINKNTPSISVNANIIPDVTGTTSLGTVARAFSGMFTSTLRSTTANNTTAANFLPDVDNTYDLGSPTQRFANIYTGDLHLKNDRGDWTVIEEDDYLSLRNNKSGKTFRLVMEEV